MVQCVPVQAAVEEVRSWNWSCVKLIGFDVYVIPSLLLHSVIPLQDEPILKVLETAAIAADNRKAVMIHFTLCTDHNDRWVGMGWVGLHPRDAHQSAVGDSHLHAHHRSQQSAADTSHRQLHRGRPAARPRDCGHQGGHGRLGLDRHGLWMGPSSCTWWRPRWGPSTRSSGGGGMPR